MVKLFGIDFGKRTTEVFSGNPLQETGRKAEDLLEKEVLVQATDKRQKLEQDAVAQAALIEAKRQAEAGRKRVAEQALRDEEAAQNPPLIQIELLPGQTEDVIKKSKLLNGKQLENYVNHLAQKNKK